MTVCGDGRHTVVNAVLGIFILDLLPAQKNPALALLEVVDRLHEFLLAVAVNTCNTDNLAGADLQVQILDCINPLLVLDIQVLNIQHNIPGGCRRLVNDQLNCTAYHHGCQIVFTDTFYRNGADILAAPNNGAGI